MLRPNNTDCSVQHVCYSLHVNHDNLWYVLIDVVVLGLEHAQTLEWSITACVVLCENNSVHKKERGCTTFCWVRFLRICLYASLVCENYLLVRGLWLIMLMRNTHLSYATIYRCRIRTIPDKTWPLRVLLPVIPHVSRAIVNRSGYFYRLISKGEMRRKQTPSHGIPSGTCCFSNVKKHTSKRDQILIYLLFERVKIKCNERAQIKSHYILCKKNTFGSTQNRGDVFWNVVATIFWMWQSNKNLVSGKSREVIRTERVSYENEKHGLQ
jgi:hypothetical protein